MSAASEKMVSKKDRASLARIRSIALRSCRGIQKIASTYTGRRCRCGGQVYGPDLRRPGSPAVEKEHVVGHLQVQAHAAGAHRFISSTWLESSERNCSMMPSRRAVGIRRDIPADRIGPNARSVFQRWSPTGLNKIALAFRFGRFPPNRPRAARVSRWFPAAGSKCISVSAAKSIQKRAGSWPNRPNSSNAARPRPRPACSFRAARRSTPIVHRELFSAADQPKHGLLSAARYSRLWCVPFFAASYRREESRGKKLEYAHQVVGAVFHGRAGQGPTPLPRNRTHKSGLSCSSDSLIR